MTTRIVGSAPSLPALTSLENTTRVPLAQMSPISPDKYGFPVFSEKFAQLASTLGYPRAEVMKLCIESNRFGGIIGYPEDYERINYALEPFAFSDGTPLIDALDPRDIFLQTRAWGGRYQVWGIQGDQMFLPSAIFQGKKEGDYVQLVYKGEPCTLILANLNRAPYDSNSFEMSMRMAKCCHYRDRRDDGPIFANLDPRALALLDKGVTLSLFADHSITGRKVLEMMNVPLASARLPTIHLRYDEEGKPQLQSGLTLPVDDPELVRSQVTGNQIIIAAQDAAFCNMQVIINEVGLTFHALTPQLFPKGAVVLRIPIGTKPIPDEIVVNFPWEAIAHMGTREQISESLQHTPVTCGKDGSRVWNLAN